MQDFVKRYKSRDTGVTHVERDGVDLHEHFSVLRLWDLEFSHLETFEAVRLPELHNHDLVYEDMKTTKAPLSGAHLREKELASGVRDLIHC